MSEPAPPPGLQAWEALGVMVGSTLLTSLLAFALGIHWRDTRRKAAWQCLAIGSAVGIVFWGGWLRAVFGG
jgi:Na+/proline symporter